MISLFKKLMPREDKFFDLFENHARTVRGAAEAMRDIFGGQGDIDALCQRIVDLENEADEITREVLLAVRRSFITPFDRGDIKDLIQSMDDAIDMMHKTVKTIRRFEQRTFDPGMKEMGVLIAEAARLISEAIPLLDKMGPNAHRLSAIAEEITAGRDVFGYRFRGQRFDCGSKAGFLQATVAFGLAREELHDEFNQFLMGMTAMRKAAE